MLSDEIIRNLIKMEVMSLKSVIVERIITIHSEWNGNVTTRKVFDEEGNEIKPDSTYKQESEMVTCPECGGKGNITSQVDKLTCLVCKGRGKLNGNWQRIQGIFRFKIRKGERKKYRVVVRNTNGDTYSYTLNITWVKEHPEISFSQEE